MPSSLALVLIVKYDVIAIMSNMLISLCFKPQRFIKLFTSYENLENFSDLVKIRLPFSGLIDMSRLCKNEIQLLIE